VPTPLCPKCSGPLRHTAKTRRESAPLYPDAPPAELVVFEVTETAAQCTRCPHAEVATDADAARARAIDNRWSQHLDGTGRGLHRRVADQFRLAARQIEAETGLDARRLAEWLVGG
jgi:hypothetical protein